MDIPSETWIQFWHSPEECMCGDAHFPKALAGISALHLKFHYVFVMTLWKGETNYVIMTPILC